MISILIPIYNQSIVDLVQEFVAQCGKAKCQFEIICLDDVSQPKFHDINRAVQHIMGVNYVELTDHCGRSKIRNKLASLARFEHLLFIDSDSKINSKRYIKKFLQAIEGPPEIIALGFSSMAWRNFLIYLLELILLSESINRRCSNRAKLASLFLIFDRPQ